MENTLSDNQADFSLVSMLLREPSLYKGQPDLLAERVTQGLAWISDMTSVAMNASIHRGALCRLVLPFGVETDAQDQANVASATVSSDSPVHPDTVTSLRQGAIHLRKLLRIKLADDNDLRQAEDACRMISDILGLN